MIYDGVTQSVYTAVYCTQTVSASDVRLIPSLTDTIGDNIQSFFCSTKVARRHQLTEEDKTSMFPSDFMQAKGWWNDEKYEKWSKVQILTEYPQTSSSFIQAFSSIHTVSDTSGGRYSSPLSPPLEVSIYQKAPVYNRRAAADLISSHHLTHYNVSSLLLGDVGFYSLM